ncbi:phosphatidylserine decarboxylase [Holosporaceae bacterium 'Namur']|nr:phosphatidylserine decarboxylase [Holosporaceae bacterium 'Namur']
MIESIKDFIPGIHKEGYVFILIFIIITLVLFLISQKLGWIGVLLTIWCIFFFRDPERVTPIEKDFVISPADGLVQRITTAKLPPELEGGDEEYTRVSIFLNVFDVHVNRIPIEGEVKILHYHPGKFFNASLDKASEHNERQSILIETLENKLVGVVQIAGLIARRIVCNLKDHEQVKTGERFGIIRFGSRVDVYLPKGIEPQVIEGQRVVGGESIIANLEGVQNKRIGEVR